MQTKATTLPDSGKPEGVSHRRPAPADCFCCEYDRRFPMTATGGWMDFGNNSPLVSCPVCNPDGTHPRA